MAQDPADRRARAITRNQRWQFSDAKRRLRGGTTLSELHDAAHAEDAEVANVRECLFALYKEVVRSDGGKPFRAEVPSVHVQEMEPQLLDYYNFVLQNYQQKSEEDAQKIKELRHVLQLQKWENELLRLELEEVRSSSLRQFAAAKKAARHS